MSRQALRARVLHLVERLADGGRDATARDALLHDLLAHQRSCVTPYENLCRQRDQADHPPMRQVG